MSKLVVGSGLVVMMAAIAFFGVVTDDTTIPVSAINGAAPLAFWAFVSGTLLAIAGGVYRAH